MDAADRVALALPAHEPDDPDVGVERQQPDQLRTRRTPSRRRSRPARGRRGARGTRRQPPCRERDREDGPPRSSTRPSSPRSQAREAARRRQARRDRRSGGALSQNDYTSVLHTHAIVALPGRVDHAEPVALRIFHDHVVGVGGALVPLDLPGAEVFQPPDLAGLVIGEQVEWMRGGTRSAPRYLSNEMLGPDRSGETTCAKSSDARIRRS